MKTKSPYTLSLAIVWLAPVVASPVAWACGGNSGHGQKHSSENSVQESAVGHSHAKSELHGGSAIMTPSHHFEVLFTAAEARVYVYDGLQAQVLDPRNARASMTLQEKGKEPLPFEMTYVAPELSAGRTQGYFVAHGDFSVAESGVMKAIIRVGGLTEKAVEFRTSVKVTEQTEYACTMHPEVKAQDPTNCSKCGMMLTRVAPAATDSQANEKQPHGADHDH